MACQTKRLQTDTKIEALRYYGMALEKVRKESEFRIVILCSLILAAFEALYGDSGAAKCHLYHGQRIGREHDLDCNSNNFL